MVFSFFMRAFREFLHHQNKVDDDEKRSKKDDRPAEVANAPSTWSLCCVQRRGRP